MVEEYMRRECDHYFETVRELAEFLLGHRPKTAELLSSP